MERGWIDCFLERKLALLAVFVRFSLWSRAQWSLLKRKSGNIWVKEVDSYCSWRRAWVSYQSLSRISGSLKLRSSGLLKESEVSTSFLRKDYLSMSPNQACLSISSTPYFAPNLPFQDLHKSFISRSLAFSLKQEGISSEPFNVPLYICSGSLLQKGGSPVKSSNKRAPKLQKSAQREWPFLATTSGDMYSGLPQKEQALLLGFLRPGLTNPKSEMQACPSLSKSMFYGFKSRQAMPDLCKSSSPSRIQVTQNLAIGSFILFTLFSAPNSSPPGQQSITKMRKFLDQKDQCNLARKGCWLVVMTFFSLMTSFCFLFLRMNDLLMTFKAQNFPSPLNLAKKTVEKPPLPIALITSKLCKSGSEHFSPWYSSNRIL